MPGTLSKQGMLVRAFKMDFGRKYSIQELAEVYDVSYTFKYRGEHEDYPEFEREKKEFSGTKKKGWYTNRAFFDYCVRNIPEKTRQGHRYMTMCALSAIAFKCDVPKWELKETLTGFLSDWNKGMVGADRVERWEITAAMKMYNERAYEMRREVIEEYFGWEFKPIKRNGQKQADHLEEARAIRDIRMKRQGRKWDENNGRPKGSGEKRVVVQKWQDTHPDGTKAECNRDTNLDPKTIRKWWNRERTNS